jgi:tripartite-type tricarboxylate transporter receptor subunit TctC
MAALLGGQLTFSVDTLFTASPFAHGGKVRILAMATEERQKSWPDIPTMRELGYGVSIDSSIGLGGPQGMKPEVVRQLQDAFKFAMQQPSVVTMLDQADQQPRYAGSAEFTKFAEHAVVYQRQLLGKYGFAAKK